MPRAPHALLPILCAVVVISLAGCAPAVYPTAGQTNIPATQPGAASTAPTDAPAPTSSAPAPASTPTPDPSSSRSAKHNKPAPPPCDSSKLTIFYVPAGNEAGKAHADIKFLNKSPAACQAYGNPFVWFADSSGNKVGDQSQSVDGTTAAIITLQPGQIATAPLAITDADFIEGCTVVSETHMVITPAGADNSALITIPATDTCSNGIVTMTVGVEVLQ